MDTRAHSLGWMVLAVLCASGPAAAQDWPQWRGPNFDGSSSARDLPVDFDREKQVRWVADLPGPGAGTAVIAGERVFVTSTDVERRRLVALCFERKSGRLLWRRAAGSGYRPGDGSGTEIALHRRSDYASPSPVTDGERVVFFYGNGDLVSFDLEGRKEWARNLQKDYGDFAFQWTFAASPTLWKKKLYLQVLQRDEPVGGLGRQVSPSYLLAIEPSSGKTLFRHLRPSPARRESHESYATPIPYRGKDGREEILVVGGDVISGHDPTSGAELWRWGTWNPGHRQEWWRIVPSPVTGADLVLVCAPKRAPLYAVRLGGSGRLGAEALAWKSSGRPNYLSSDVPTPLFYQGSFFVLSDVREALSRVEPASGKIEWTLRLPGEYRWRASPTGADGRIWCINHHGDVIVVDAEKGEIVHRAALGEEDADGIRASIAIAHGHLFIRTRSRLYCIGK